MEHVNCPISEHANSTPDQLALISDRRTWTYRELNAEIHALCSFLDNVGVKEKERIAFVASSNCATVLLFFALFRMRAIACPLSYRLSQEQVADYILMLKAAHVLEPSILPPDMVRCSNRNSSIYLDDFATYLFTSGSSGTPKIACHHFASHYYNALGANPKLQLNSSSRWQLTLPLFHVSGIGILFRCFLAGGAIVLSDLPITESIPQFGITHISMVPTQLIRLLKEPTETLKKAQNSLKCLLLGGAPIASDLLTQAARVFLPVFTTYGMTEMGSMVTLSQPNLEKSSGKLLPYREMKIEDGEILVRGKTLFQGYWDTVSEKVVINDRNGWFATKDLGKISTDEELEVTGRKDRQFISGGENIQPEEIEQAICAIPGIRQASVLPIPDVEFGARPIAFIDDETHAHNLESIKEGLRTRLPSFKHPIRIFRYPVEAGIKPSLAVLKQHLEQFQERALKKPG